MSMTIMIMTCQNYNLMI